jgi:hypothetical protein
MAPVFHHGGAFLVAFSPHCGPVGPAPRGLQIKTWRVVLLISRKLLQERRFGEEELRGLRDDKLKSIRSYAEFLTEMDAAVAGLIILLADFAVMQAM